jgi:uncharacterized membrane protein SirB2
MMESHALLTLLKSVNVFHVITTITIYFIIYTSLLFCSLYMLIHYFQEVANNSNPDWPLDKILLMLIFPCISTFSLNKKKYIYG